VNAAPVAHVHRWRCEEQNGPTARAHCPCGETRVFQNTHIDDRPGGRGVFGQAEGAKLCIHCGQAVARRTIANHVRRNHPGRDVYR
jgi:hypothetical protein